jgi:hypothetical protein
MAGRFIRSSKKANLPRRKQLSNCPLFGRCLGLVWQLFACARARSVRFVTRAERAKSRFLAEIRKVGCPKRDSLGNLAWAGLSRTGRGLRRDSGGLDPRLPLYSSLVICYTFPETFS